LDLKVQGQKSFIINSPCGGPESVVQISEGEGTISKHMGGHVHVNHLQNLPHSQFVFQNST
jgi:hypothetical protein